MADNECREADCAHWLGRNLGCEYPDLDGCRIDPSNWCCVAQCDDGQTAITVADALQNFMRTGLIGDDFHTRTRLVGEKGV